MVNTPLCRETAFEPSGDIVRPKGSCVILLTFPAGATYRPLGKMETPPGLTTVVFARPGTCRRLFSCAKIELKTKKETALHKNKDRMVHHLVHNISK
jgi:hypothetical protein